MAPREVYEQIESGDWYTRPKSWFVQCCDCGLVHREQWRLTKVKGKWKIEFRTVREQRRTAAVRRKHKFVLDDHE